MPYVMIVVQVCRGQRAMGVAIQLYKQTSKKRELRSSRRFSIIARDGRTQRAFATVSRAVIC